jgi:hypothetical protein
MEPDDNLEKRISCLNNKRFSTLKRRFRYGLGYVGLFLGLGVFSLLGSEIESVLKQNPHIVEITAEQVEASDIKTTYEAYPGMSREEIKKLIIKASESGDYKDIIKQIKTPYWSGFYSTEILKYKEDSELYKKDEYWASFKEIHENKAGDCEDIATAIAAVLFDDGFQPCFLLLKSNFIPHHTVFLYKSKENNKFGILGGEIFECTLPIFDSVDEIYEKIFIDKIDYKIIKFKDNSFIYNPVKIKDIKKVVWASD